MFYRWLAYAFHRCTPYTKTLFIFVVSLVSFLLLELWVVLLLLKRLCFTLWFELVFCKQSRLQYFVEYHTQNLERKTEKKRTKYLIQLKLGYYLPFVWLFTLALFRYTRTAFRACSISNDLLIIKKKIKTKKEALGTRALSLHWLSFRIKIYFISSCCCCYCCCCCCYYFTVLLRNTSKWNNAHLTDIKIVIW